MIAGRVPFTEFEADMVQVNEDMQLVTSLSHCLCMRVAFVWVMKHQGPRNY